ncbi:hypothetical protein [Paragemmobacter straminiformis]|uniref:hypothetical protein n=1 Tax=Paragemmobacter straminiformis TaxID=2045119 RepID=UPI00163B1CF0|nr:hypothetical protein [Gemmobacter straminiformis]
MRNLFGAVRRLRENILREDGAMTYPSLVFLGLAVLAGGVSVDVIRHEATRSKVQQALDSCTETAATTEAYSSTSQSIATTINDCMARAGVSGLINPVTVSYNAGLITASVTGTQQNFFMNMVQKSTLTFAGGSVARIAAPQFTTEVALAYEATNYISTSGLADTVKGGMTDFVDRFFQSDAVGRNTLALVPYNSGVNLQPALLARYNVVNVANLANSNCLDLDAAEFGKADMSRSKAFNTITPVDLFTATSTSILPSPYSKPTSTSGTRSGPSTTCPPYAATVLRLPANDATAIKANISTADFRGGTRWDHGMNWAAAILDPSAQNAISALMPQALSDRPLAYGTTNTRKVIVFVNSFGSGDDPLTGDAVLLTPAFNVAAPGGSGPLSPVYQSKNATDTFYSIYVPTASTANKYWRPDNGTWEAGPYTPPSATQSARQLSWAELWSNVRATWVAWQLYGRSGGTTTATMNAAYTAALNSMKATLPFATQSSQFLAECTAAKAKGVVVYTVLLDPPNGRAAGPMASCATSSAHAFTTSSANFRATMTAIAAAIRAQETPT